MWDKIDLEIPFANHAVVLLHSQSEEDRKSGSVDVRRYDFPLHGPLMMVDGKAEPQEINAQRWGTISSGISGVAVGFFPHGNGFNRWPHIRLKASPAKILQGHNVFGSECPKQGVAQMFAYLRQAYPLIYADLDVENAQVKYTDSTYSARIAPHFSPKVFRLFESLATRRTKVNAAYMDRGYLQLGADSDRQRAKLYSKYQEVMDDLKQAKRAGDSHRVRILGDSRLIDFCQDLHRFEATTGPRKFEELGIPTRFPEFVKFLDWFKSVHNVPLCRYLWQLCFDPLFAQFEGHSMKNVDDSHIKALIDKAHIRVKENGKICKRRAKAVYDTYRAIKMDGYETLCSEDSKTFFRNVKFLEEAGISRAFLKSLDPHKPFDNVIPFIQMIKIDFSQQRPDWYEEPVASVDLPGRQLKMVVNNR